jgi:mono/diheme cytochrome c family protein
VLDPSQDGRHDHGRVKPMSRILKVSVVVGVMLVAGAIGALLFVGSGVYNIGADDHHLKLTLALIEQLRDRSIETRAGDINVPALEDSARIVAGGERYASLCVSCHLAPGVMKSSVRAGLYPHPPSLSQEAVIDPKRAFWIVKHGIKMSAMPAWGTSLDDAAIWDIVAFVRQLPNMSPETYQQMTKDHAS